MCPVYFEHAQFAQILRDVLCDYGSFVLISCGVFRHCMPLYERCINQAIKTYVHIYVSVLLFKPRLIVTLQKYRRRTA